MQRSKTPSGAPLTNILGPDPIRLGFLGVQKVDIDLRSLENSKVNSFFHLASISFLKNVKNIHYYFLGEKNQYFILPTTSQEPKPILNSKTTTVSSIFLVYSHLFFKKLQIDFSSKINSCQQFFVYIDAQSKKQTNKKLCDRV